ncbi:FlaA [Rhodobacteraceae bacterium RKSG542]|uniref:MotE family protein n=1 Tax=Pseudovibrio flavus TaxID=2529854 RepID=UPI0012BCBD15|nr:FlaA [Pseudovibrio flavus]MTI19277.1 FlaA [Pseudovibrio flavus]
MTLRLLPLVVFAGSALLVLKLMSFFIEDKASIGMLRDALANNGTALDARGVDTTLPAGMPDLNSGAIGSSPSERELLKSLGSRREELNKREQELQLREQMLSAAEARVEKRIAELKAMEEELQSTESRQKEQAAQEILDLVSIYESMNAKNAARIFNRLELDVLLRVVKKMQPRKMADVLASMDPEAAERLTVALAMGGAHAAASGATILPKIKGN